MFAWLTATPNFDVAQGQSGFYFNLILTIFCIFLSGFLFYLGKRSNKT